jgi:hypothetical protein
MRWGDLKKLAVRSASSKIAFQLSFAGCHCWDFLQQTG